MQAIEIERRHEFHDAIIKSCKYTRCDLDYPRMGWTMIDQNAACFLYQRDLNRSLNDHKYKRYWSYRRIAQEFSVEMKSRCGKLTGTT